MPTVAQEHNQNLLPPADWAVEIEKLNEELANERDRTLRTLADFKNYRRRIEREGNKVAEEGMRGIILALLDMVDDMEKALKFVNDPEQHSVKGLRIIHQKSLALLQNYGVVPIESVGMLFDHNLHEAIAMTKHKSAEPGIIVDELRRGYLWNNVLLRPAQVRVAG